VFWILRHLSGNPERGIARVRAGEGALDWRFVRAK
jgi:hypothetical protein